MTTDSILEKRKEQLERNASAAAAAAEESAARHDVDPGRGEGRSEAGGDAEKSLPTTVEKGNNIGTDLEVLAARSRQIAKMDEPRTLPGHVLDQSRIIHANMADRETLNRFRHLRTKLLQTARKSNFITMVTSIHSGGGGSYVAANLATSIAMEESRTSMLVDCNLRDPSLAKMFKLNADAGLADLLDNKLPDLDQIIYPAGVRRLRLVPAGRRIETTSEYFSSVRMRKFLHTAQQRYRDRYIVLDAPPIGESADASILAELCDRVIIVVPYAKVTEAQINAAIDSIDRGKLFGLVMNDEPA